MLEDDTIAAIATPVGMGGIGIIKISGSKSLNIAEGIFRSKHHSFALQSHQLQYGEIIDTKDGSVIDEVLISFMHKPISYTKEDVVEINCHSGLQVLQRILEAVLREGARLAESGEFTKRAFLNGRIDLSQAEAVIDIVKSQTDASLKIANRQLRGALSKEVMRLKEEIVTLLAPIEASIDFPEEDIDIIPFNELQTKMNRLNDSIEVLIDSYEEGRLYREGISAAIVGKPNVGKSSLLNSLLKENRAIVTPIPGTTRDFIEEAISIKGFPLKIIDTAGIEDTRDIIEEEGIKLAKEKLRCAEIVLLVLDSSQGLNQGDLNLIAELTGKKVVIVLNKIDLVSEPTLNRLQAGLKDSPTVPISALHSWGIEELKEVIFSMIAHYRLDASSSVFVTNTRHKLALERTLESLRLANESITQEMSPEFIALDMQRALKNLGEIVGDTPSDDILDTIFSEFCIGK